MNLLDLVILLPLLFFSVQGYRNGIVRELLTITGILLAVWLSFRYMGSLAGLLETWIDRSAEFLTLISALIIFVTVLVLSFLISNLLSRFLEMIRLETVNRLFGMGFGALKCGVILSVFLLILSGFDIPARQTREKSLTYPLVIRMAPAAYDLIATFYPGSEKFMDRIRNTFHEDTPFFNLQNSESLNVGSTDEFSPD